MSDEESQVNHEREAYLTEMRSQALICGSRLFRLAAQENIRSIPLLHACAFRREAPDGQIEEGIIIDYDQYKSGWSRDYTHLIPYELEHEVVELWLTKDKKNVDPFGPDHYEAARAAMRKAFQEGQMDDYIEMRREAAKLFQALGDDHAMEELGFYKQYAEELRSGKAN